jgi:hypothetical protein
MCTRSLPHCFLVGLACIATAAHAQPTPSTEPPEEPPSVANTQATAPSPFSLSGYGEAYYQWNFNDPANGITNFRGFDNRHNSFTLSNVAIDAQWDDTRLIGRLTLQVGHTPATYYLAEPTSEGASGANASSADLWHYLQQAYVGHHFGSEQRLSVTAGLFLSPIGPESMAVKDNWNWSRSNSFFGLPFYHTGARVIYAVADAWSVTLAGYNGWNSVVDNNAQKSVSTQVTYTTPAVVLSALYFGGVERARGAAEGRAWRHLLDAHATWNVAPVFSLLAHVNAGMEPNVFGISRWLAGALYGLVRLDEALLFALRGDAFVERRAQNPTGEASAIFWPAPWVASGTATMDFRPHERVSFRLEYRHDAAGMDMFFGRQTARDDAANDSLPNRASQHTFTFGATSWF